MAGKEVETPPPSSLIISAKPFMSAKVFRAAIRPLRNESTTSSISGKDFCYFFIYDLNKFLSFFFCRREYTSALACKPFLVAVNLVLVVFVFYFRRPRMGRELYNA